MTPAARHLASARMLAVSVAVGLALALATPAVLGWTARPAGLDRRVAALQADADTVRSARDMPGDPAVYSANPLCTDAPREAARLTAELQRRGQGLHLARLQAGAEPSGASTGRLSEVGFHLEGNGDYGHAIALLQGLATHTPAVLIERMDLTSRSGFLHLHLGGRVYCRPRATS